MARFGSLDGRADLDRFNRVVTSKWTKDITAPAADVDFFNVAVGWDRNSNVTYQDDSVHDAFGAAYTNDDLNRLIVSAEGLGTGGTISTLKRKQEWTLTQTGNWTLDKLDLNGDADWSDTDEWQDGRTHNDVNELTARDLDNNSGTSGDNYSLAYDAAGNLTDDGTDYEYEWDAFYRLRKVKRTDNQALVAEYRYNGLGYRIAEHADTDTDGDVDGNDKWFYFAYDNRWRLVATFRESDSSPKEEFVHQHAGMRGSGSYIDLVAFRDKDANTAWTTASDGTLEERLYYCQNWRADVVAIVSSAAVQKEQARYSAYGVPFGLPAGDADSDGDCDAADGTIVTGWKNAPSYDVRGDIDLDGDIDATDESAVAGLSGVTLGREVLSAVLNRTGFAGSKAALPFSPSWHSRNRLLASAAGRWATRDPLYSSRARGDSGKLYAYVADAPLSRVDPYGLFSLPPSAPAVKCNCPVKDASASILSQQGDCAFVVSSTPGAKMAGDCAPYKVSQSWGPFTIEGFGCAPMPDSLPQSEPQSTHCRWYTALTAQSLGGCQFTSSDVHRYEGDDNYAAGSENGEFQQGLGHYIEPGGTKMVLPLAMHQRCGESWSDYFVINTSGGTVTIKVSISCSNCTGGNVRLIIGEPPKEH